MLYNKKKYINIYLFIFLWLICLISFNPEKYSNYSNWKIATFQNFQKRFFCPHDMIGLLQSNLGIFLLGKFGVVWVYIDLPGVVIWQHIHSSTLHSYWEEGAVLVKVIVMFFIRRNHKIWSWLNQNSSSTSIYSVLPILFYFNVNSISRIWLNCLIYW